MRQVTTMLGELLKIFPRYETIPEKGQGTGCSTDFILTGQY